MYGCYIQSKVNFEIFISRASSFSRCWEHQYSICIARFYAEKCFLSSVKIPVLKLCNECFHKQIRYETRRYLLNGKGKKNSSQLFRCPCSNSGKNDSQNMFPMYCDSCESFYFRLSVKIFYSSCKNSTESLICRTSWPVIKRGKALILKSANLLIWYDPWRS